ncbi:LysR family transcriptional regulator [Vulcaniibacterium tengchongense]|uniref:DNA-binding transcriptional LysR family regulator n=1 Tax=Vulcaniibacterium tengchongense TaxID=1273429 RepID=A0A3N4W4K8_9GAMM|nr:LysR family transcriptional regulator [Vulcaniibacterium tengchongense]RPE80164.1 DNA-binding transcriptional LysR family regulator [Vulcaniibacterium tengchongense]
MSTIPSARAPGAPLDLAGLLAFVRVAELGSFVRAAENLGLSKAAVSKQVAALERRLGARLLHRTTRRLSLTEAGQAYLLHAQAALAEARAAENAVADTQTVPQGRLRVTVPMSFGLLHVAPWVSAFLREYPAIDLDLQLDDRARDLVLEGYDLAIRFGSQLRDSSLVARRLCDVRVLLCAAPDYLERHGRPGHPDQLNGYDCLHYSYNPTGRAWQFRRGEETVRVALATRMEANSSLALRAAMLAGGGLARVPEFVVADDVAAGRLEIVLPDWQLPALSLHAVMPERRYVPAKVRAFVDFLAARWAAQPGWRRAADGADPR